MSLFYTATLVLNPIYYTRHIKIYQPKKQTKLVLVRVKELQERYRDKTTLLLAILGFLYNDSQKLRELNAFNQITITLYLVVIRLLSRNKYIDYNLEDSYNPSIKRALAQQYQDIQRQYQLRLLLMTINILLILLISNKLERVFLGAYYIVSQDRDQLELETIKIRKYLKYQKRSRILDTFFEDSQFRRESYLLKLLYNKRIFQSLLNFPNFFFQSKFQLFKIGYQRRYYKKNPLQN